MTNGNQTSTKVGLVLSGGGALGAYQAGVVRALSEFDVPIQMVSGSSVGALNAAMVASSSSLGEAAESLEKLWRELGSASPLETRYGWLLLLLASGLGASYLNILKAIPIFSSALDGGIFSNENVKNILKNNLSPARLGHNIDFFVSVYETRGPFLDILDGIKKVTGFRAPESQFLNINDLPEGERYDAILASAALPIILGPQAVGNKRYVDGGIGGGSSCQGNTPATPLVNKGCTHLVVCHLDEGTLWDRRQYPDVEIIEISIQEPIGTEGALSDVLKFSPEKVERLIRRGYEDTKASVGHIYSVLRLRQNMRDAADAKDREADHAIEAINRLDDDAFSRYFK